MNKFFLSIGAALLLGASAVHAAKFNPEAMRKMQAQGNQMADQVLELHPYRLPSGKCLQMGGGALPARVIIADCNGSPRQNWKFDAGRRFINQTGPCMAVAGDPAAANVRVHALPCGKGGPFVWSRGADGRITHAGGKCLTAKGNPNKAGIGVGVAPCAGAPTQVWR